MAAKTAAEIESDVYRIIKNGKLATSIRGTVMRAGMRRKDAQTEDAVVVFKTGTDAQTQKGIVQIHVYVPDKNVLGDGEKAKDLDRITSLARVMADVSDEMTNDAGQTEYIFERSATIKDYPVEGIAQHFINLELTYQRTTI